MIKIKYLRDIEHIKKIEIGNMIDLRCGEDIYLEKGEYRLIPLGVAMELPQNFYAQVYPRSSTFSKYKIIMACSVGIIDHAYCGDKDEWFFPAIAMEKTFIPKGSRICQFRIFEQQPELEFVEVESLNNKNRGGIGSTGEQ